MELKLNDVVRLLPREGCTPGPFTGKVGRIEYIDRTGAEEENINLRYMVRLEEGTNIRISGEQLQLIAEPT